MSLTQFLPLTSPSHPSTVISAHRALYAHLLSTGNYQPYVYPYRALGPHILIAYLLLPPINPSTHPRLAKVVHEARWAVLAAVVWFCAWAMVECRSPMVGVAYGVGLVNAWSVLWAGTLVGWVDMRGSGMRVEARRAQKTNEGTEGGGNQLDREVKNGISKLNGNAGAELRRRKGDQSSPDTANPDDEADSRFIWQGLPPTLRHRVAWVTDLVTNFRGVRWSHQISGLPYPDVSSLSAFAEPISHQFHEPTTTSPQSLSKPYPSRFSLFRYNFIGFISILITVDILKFLVLKDSYYWGLPDAYPSPFPFARSSRLVLSLAAIYISLNSIFLLAPLVFACLAGERLLGEHAWPWLYPPLFGSPMEVWRHGLAGFWGGWWHQMFRYAFEQLGELIARPLGWEKKSIKGSVLRVAVAFVASGTLHACGSYTTLGETQPLRAFVFFALQPLGFLTQRAVAGWMKKAGLRERIPAQLRGAANLGLVIAWFWLTGPMVADDFALGGIWLLEPLPISPARGLAGEGWWRWGGRWFSWHKDEHWWKSGLAV